MTSLSSPPRRVPDADGPPASVRLGYRPALDGFRAVAIVLVLLHHTGAFLLPGWPTWSLRGGFLGVDLFFVLSGFLITTLLLERRGRERRPILRFYERRALRLFPAVLALVLVVGAYVAITGHDRREWPQTFAVVLTYSMNWAEVAGVSLTHYVTQLWSLAVEEQFYLVWPLVVYGGLRLVRAPSRLAWIVLGLAVLVAVWRVVLWRHGVSWLWLYQRTDTHADGLLIGAAVALAPWRAAIARVSQRTATIAGAGALAAIFLASELCERDHAFLYLGGFTLVSLLAMTCILAALRGGAFTSALAVGPAVLVGRLSYSLYLWHYPVFRAVGEETASWPTPLRVVAAWALAFGAAYASYRFVERPALAYKRRIGERRAAVGSV